MSEFPDTEDKFESGIFWNLYTDLERQFQNFLEDVPYLDGNENVYSFRLLNLILSIGGCVDSAFKEMARYPLFSDNNDCRKILEKMRKSAENIERGRHPIPVSIKLCLRAFENVYKLSQKKVMFKRLPKWEKLQPFKPHNRKTNAPEWWEIYNGLKHDVSVNIRNANLKITMNALASAFLLNVIHIPGYIWLCQYGIAKPSLRGAAYFTTDAKKIKEKIEEFVREGKNYFFGFAETPLFVYPA
jgi:hypothetical protein